MSEYVTVVSVDLHPKLTVNAIKNAHNGDVGVATAAASAAASSAASAMADQKSSFVTVLSINNNQNTTTISTTAAAEHPHQPTREGEIVTVYRSPGERLGFGLKFQGGTKTDEKVQRLFIQSCDADSPASKAIASWGSLGEGDEILKIDNEPVTTMTRIECVKCLKDRNDAINLLVRQRSKTSTVGAQRNGTAIESPKKRPKPPPPPMVPPRKIYRKPVPVPTSMTTSLKSQPLPVISIEPPPTPVAAELYLNTLDDELDVMRNDESDETGSTISSQISVISNFSSESDLSLLSTSTMCASNSDLTKILTKPFQMIEREFNVNGSHILPCPATSSMSIDNLLLFSDSDHSSSSAAVVGNIVDDEKIKIDVNTSMETTVAAVAFSPPSSMSMSSAKVYENIDVISNDDNDDEDQRQYENISIKLPPIPRPRSISSAMNSSATMLSMSQDVKIDLNAKSPSNGHNSTVESWLNDAKVENGNRPSDKNGSLKDDRRRSSYEEAAIKFECFAASNDDDDEDDKLGPPELLDMSEAYFNFSWCGNSNGNLPTIGEAEEECSSIEPITGQQGASNKLDKR